MGKKLIHLIIALAGIFPAVATSPTVAEITQKQVTQLEAHDELFEADVIAYKKCYMLNGHEHKLSATQLATLKKEAYAIAHDFKKLSQSTYMQIRVCHVIQLKVTKAISGNTKVGEIKQILVSDHIDSMCPHFAAYEQKFSPKPHLVWLIKWNKSENGLLEKYIAVSAIKDFDKIRK